MNTRKNFEEVLYALPPSVREVITKIPDDLLQEVEEIRLRVNRPLTVYLKNEEKFVSKEGTISFSPSLAYIVTSEDCEKALQLISKSSLYAFEEEIRNGYITLKGGYRVGIVGKCVLENGYIKTLKNISGYNYRISKEIIGVAEEILKYLITPSNGVHNILIISPPQCGKTTLLRDITRWISNGIDFLGFKGKKVGAVDERSEIAGCYNGIPQMDVGLRTDVLDGCPKAYGMIMLIRSMSPEVVVTDEIGKKEDIEAIHEVLNTGVKIITTVHANDIEDLMKKPVLKDVISLRYFERYVILSNRLGAGTVEKILDENFNTLFKGPYRRGRTEK
ncbi:stage III sporulation protein AA [Thermoanaerobacter sp. CM-CNRG TB177]|uniref:stage III sporulation protein AA n=1 Tax=Thermoanaerobacter sp. CM-CNRG TB177 TaxID=2800659 RepID=UPI001BDF1CD9|nr:stage III sporulation protein AA [Thermoanaerobacter sp. CM-CNRG TB177]MBT1279818.1 stage III sporulation protein AA [Thermoanaerobacter sp. CM-CNRG TB177]